MAMQRGEPRSVAANAYEFCSAQLNQLCGVLRHSACLQPGAEPTVGWLANGSSMRVVKIRTNDVSQPGQVF